MCEIICSLTLVAGSNPTAGHGDRPLSSQAAVGAGTKKIPTCSMALSAEYRTKFFSTGKHWRLHMSKKNSQEDYETVYNQSLQENDKAVCYQNAPY